MIRPPTPRPPQLSDVVTVLIQRAEAAAVKAQHDLAIGYLTQAREQITTHINRLEIAKGAVAGRI